jgi:hypothetical protein
MSGIEDPLKKAIQNAESRDIPRNATGFLLLKGTPTLFVSRDTGPKNAFATR